MSFIFVALGGAVGACGRHAISLIPLKTSFPFLTLFTNIGGALLIGFIVGIAEQHEDTPKNLVTFLKTGVCGGFTTFSTFSLETYNLFTEKMYGLAILYMILSIVSCIFGVWIGKKLSLLCKGV